MNLRLWIDALRVIPRVSPEEWKQLDFVAKWLIVSRSAVFVMTFISACIGGILAWRDGAFDWTYWILATLGLIFAHASNNILNDLVDFIKGVDEDNYFRAQYGPHPLQHGFLSRRSLLLYFLGTLLVAVAIGLYLIWAKGAGVLWFFVAGLFFLLFYTYPLKYIGLGEIAVLAVWGPLMVGGMYYVLTEGIRWEVIVASLPYAAGVTSVLFGKHLDKLQEDRVKGIRTLPVILGERLTRFTTIALMLIQYGAVLVLIITRFFSPVLLIVLFAFRDLKEALRVYSSPKPAQKPSDYPDHSWPLWFVAYAFVHNRKFGLLYIVGLFLDTLLVRMGVFS